MIQYLRFFTYAALVAAYFLWPGSRTVIPVSVTSGSAAGDALDSRPIRYIESSEAKELPRKIRAVRMPCSYSEFFAAAGIDPVKRNLPVNYVGNARFAVEQYLIVPRDSGGWGCELVLFEEKKPSPQEATIHRAEVWVTRSNYAGREEGSVYLMQGSSYYLASISDFLGSGPK